MFDFFIALFGGGYYLSKYCKENFKGMLINDGTTPPEYIRAELRSRYGATLDEESIASDMIRKGYHYEEICNWFKDDFEYVLGENWKEILEIPSHPLPDCCLPVGACGSASPQGNRYWIYHLLLARQGKIDGWAFDEGYLIGGEDMNAPGIKYAKCIEKHLNKAGADVRLALKLNAITSTRRRTPSDNFKCAYIVVEGSCFCPTHRLW